MPRVELNNVELWVSPVSAIVYAGTAKDGREQHKIEVTDQVLAAAAQHLADGVNHSVTFPFGTLSFTKTGDVKGPEQVLRFTYKDLETAKEASDVVGISHPSLQSMLNAGQFYVLNVPTEAEMEQARDAWQTAKEQIPDMLPVFILPAGTVLHKIELITEEPPCSTN